jgi:Glycosyltransferase family 87
MSTDPRSSPDREMSKALWDPANALPAARKWIWAILATCIAIAQGPSFLHSVRTTWADGNDFFQDWASARNVLDGRPAYLPMSDAVSRYVPTAEGSRPPIAIVPWNFHPPTSVLAVLPLALFDYPTAGTIWNVLGLIALSASLGLIFRELDFPVPAWSILPIATLGLLCGPIRGQVAQGQWNAALLLLLTLAWVADRRGRNLSAGLWVSAAASLKLFPIFFLLYFVSRRRWRTVIGGTLWMVTFGLITVAILGVDAYRDYLYRVLPTPSEFRSSWVNASLLAFWTKNFVAGASHCGLYVAPPIRAPLLARAGIVLSYASVLGTTIFYVNKSRSTSSKNLMYRDLCYSLAILTMLLLYPICWDHYLLLLALPLSLIWTGLGRSGLQRIAFLVLVAAVWVGSVELWRVGGVDLQAGWPDFQIVPPRTYTIHRPFFVPVFLSLHFYALLVCYAWLVYLAQRELAAART